MGTGPASPSAGREARSDRELTDLLPSGEDRIVLRGGVRPGTAITPKLVAMAGAGLINSTLKAFFARPRPQLFEWLTEPISSSFPSGHAMSSAIVYFTVAYLIARLEKRRWMRAVTIIASLLGVPDRPGSVFDRIVSRKATPHLLSFSRLPTPTNSPRTGTANGRRSDQDPGGTPAQFLYLWTASDDTGMGSAKVVVVVGMVVIGVLGYLEGSGRFKVRDNPEPIVKRVPGAVLFHDVISPPGGSYVDEIGQANRSLLPHSFHIPVKGTLAGDSIVLALLPATHDFGALIEGRTVYVVMPPAGLVRRTRSASSSC